MKGLGRDFSFLSRNLKRSRKVSTSLGKGCWIPKGSEINFLGKKNVKYSTHSVISCKGNKIEITQSFSSVQSLSRVGQFATPWTAARQASLFITNSRSLLKLMSIESVMPSNHLDLCCPILLSAFNLSQHQGLFQWVSSTHQVATLLEFQFQYQSFQWIFRVEP